MEKHFFTNRILVGEEFHLRKNVYVTVSKGRIQEISAQKPANSEKIIKFEKSLMVPSFINSHTHIADFFFKDQGYGMDIEKVVAPPNGLKHRFLRKTSKKMKMRGILLAIKEMLSGGITSFIDFREEGTEGAKVLKSALEGHEIRGWILGRPSSHDNIQEILSVCDGIGLSSLNSLSNKRLKAIHQEINKEEKLIAYHASETLDLRRESRDLHGENDILRGIRYLHPTFIVHGTHASKKDMRHLKREEIPVILCPRANAYLGVGIPPIEKFINEGINLSIGTDNLMINSPNLFREFDFLVRIARLQGITIHPREVLKMVTVNPSNFLKGDHCLEEGTSADFFVFDLEESNVKGVDNLFSALILRGSKKNIEKTYINGKLVWEESYT